MIDVMLRLGEIMATIFHSHSLASRDK